MSQEPIEAVVLECELRGACNRIRMAADPNAKPFSPDTVLDYSLIALGLQLLQVDATQRLAAILEDGCVDVRTFRG